MPLFRRHTLKPDVESELRALLGRDPSVLGWGSGPRVTVVALPDSFWWRLEGRGWSSAEWYQVRTGGWKYEESLMWWRLSDGASEKLVLDQEGTFPGAFRDRVQASIAVQKRIELEEGSQVLISARRRLVDEPGALIWEVLPLAGAKLDDPVVAAEVERSLAEMRADYDL